MRLKRCRHEGVVQRRDLYSINDCGLVACKKSGGMCVAVSCRQNSHLTANATLVNNFLLRVNILLDNVDRRFFRIKARVSSDLPDRRISLRTFEEDPTAGLVRIRHIDLLSRFRVGLLCRKQSITFPKIASKELPDLVFPIRSPSAVVSPSSSSPKDTILV